MKGSEGKSYLEILNVLKLGVKEIIIGAHQGQRGS